MTFPDGGIDPMPDHTCAACEATDLWFDRDHSIRIAEIGKWRSRSGKHCIEPYKNAHQPGPCGGVCHP